MIAPLIRNKPKRFVVANLIGGVLTFSISFYAIMLILYLHANYKNNMRLVYITIIATFIDNIDVLSYSSGIERLIRAGIFLDAIDGANVFEYMFGFGVFAGSELYKGFSSGLLIYIFEVGFLAATLITLIFYKITQNKKVLWIFLLIGLVIDPARIPLFWLFAVLVSVKEIRHSPFTAY